jgi:hypothetical protein
MAAENQGFYYIHLSQRQTFAYGRIMDITGTTVCPGEIVPQTDMDGETFEDCTFDIGYYAPVIPGVPIRIFWDPLAQLFNVSTATQVYTDYRLTGVNFDLLDREKCYYATVIPDGSVVLTYVTDIGHPWLTVPDLSEDLAFEQHRELFKCANPGEIYRVARGATLFFRYNGEIIQM